MENSAATLHCVSTCLTEGEQNRKKWKKKSKIILFRSNWEGGMVFWLPFGHVFGHRLAQNHTNSDAQNEIWLHLLCCAEHSRHQQHTTKNENNANADLSKWENSFKQKLAKRKFLFISCRIVVGAAEWQNKRADWDAIAAGIFEMKCWTNANLPPVKIVKFVALNQCWIVDIFIRCWRTFHIYSILYISIVTTASSTWPIFIISILFYICRCLSNSVAARFHFSIGSSIDDCR